MKRVAKDKYNQEIKNGDIINIHQTVNGCRYFVVIDLDNLDVRYYDNNHQGVGFDSWVAIDRKYEYDVEELLNMKPDPNWGFIESEIEVVGRLTEEELLQTQLGSRSGVDLEEYLVDNGIKGTIEEESTKEDFEAGFYYGSKFARKLLDETPQEIKDKVSEYANKIVNGLNLSEEDVNTIIETKQKKTYTEEDVIFMVNKMVEYYMFVTQVPIQMNLINGFLKDNFNFFKDEE